MTKHEEMQAFVRYYKRQNKKTVVTMAEIAKAAIAQGWPVPPPVSGEERLAKQFADAEREEIRYDKKTKRPYRANLAMTQRLKDGKQLALWIDTDEANRSQMVAAINKYREQMVGEAEIGTNTVEHWNRINPDQPALPFPLDFTDEVEWRRNATVEEKSGKPA
jgi:hypothetical protein